MGLNSALTQIVIVGAIALCCPGLFNALNGLGAAGAATPKYSNTANAALYAFFAVFGYFGGVFFNTLGNRILLCGGGLSYALYALGIYLASNIEGADWVALLVGIILGIGAGLFWTAQGAMMMAYSTPQNRGKYVGIFWTIFNIGGLLGGILQMGINWKSTTGEANPASYFTFIGVMAFGAIISPFVIVAPRKVEKEDGTMVEFEETTDYLGEVVGAVKASTNPYMLLLLALFVASNWFYTYQFNFVNGSLFTVRTRGLNSALYWGAQMLAAWLLGLMLDLPNTPKRTRAVYGYIFGFTLFAAAWLMGVWLQWGFEYSYDKDLPMIDTVDLSQSKRAAFPIIIYIFYGLADAALQAYAYWIMGALAGDDTRLAARFAGFYKGTQSAGAAVAWGIDTNKKVTYKTQYWVSFALWALGSLLAWPAVRDITNEEVDSQPAIQKSISVLNNTAEGAIAATQSVKETRSMSGSRSMV